MWLSCVAYRCLTYSLSRHESRVRQDPLLLDRYRLTRLPKYMVLHMRRFTKNNFFVEKNPTIVNFPVKNLKLQDIVPVPTGAPDSAS